MEPMTIKPVKRLTQSERNQQTREELMLLSKEELVSKIIQITAHNEQLKNILNRNSNVNNPGPKSSKKKFDFNQCNYRRIALKVYYLGWKFDGFATQEESGNTVEDHLMNAFVKTCLIKDRSSSNYHRCGRTDKGVSSYGQVISLTVRSKLPVDDQSNISNELDYCNILNHVLPEGIQCSAWAPVDEDFSARFNCVQRKYKYFFPKGNLNIPLMSEAAQKLVGSHDFRNLCKMDVAHGVVTFTRTITDITIKPMDLSTPKLNGYEMYVFTVTSKAFLWHQIRCIMSILLLIGEEKESPEIIDFLVDVESNPRRPQYPLASHLPLNLFQCDYENVNWINNQDNAEYVIRKLQSSWSEQAIKAAMIKEMLNDLEQKTNVKYSCQNESLIEGTRTRNHIPLMERPTCPSLESKIDHYVKRQKLEIKTDGDS